MKWMTPQAHASRTASVDLGNRGRYSLAGRIEPQRIVKDQQPWRVRDLVVGPAPSGSIPPSRSLPDRLGGDGTDTKVSGVGRGAGNRESLIPVTDMERQVGFLFIRRFLHAYSRVPLFS